MSFTLCDPHLMSKENNHHRKIDVNKNQKKKRMSMLKSLKFYQIIRQTIPILIFTFWLLVCLRSFLPIIWIDKIIVHYDDEQQQQQQQNGQTDDDQLRLQRMKDSMLSLTIIFIIFTSIISIIGIIGLILDRITLTIMYSLYILMTLMFIIIQIWNDPFVWFDNNDGNNFLDTLIFLSILIITNLSIFLYIFLWYWHHHCNHHHSRQQQYLLSTAILDEKSSAIQD
uniref:Uncharacterized protein LOC113792964 n=2 Tax=Dermatophagoides pteronyssinus TaxID=6956 RepID=A0A6P6Y2Z2_DERPT|nr:uncharacterized protein LOC113792964 [Dermatophagoides pteronyssinus]